MSGALRIFVNALSGAGARVAMMGVGFLLTPYIVHELGVQTYGLWSVIGSLAGYLGLLDFGLGGAFVKFIAEYVERERRDDARQIVAFGMLFYTLFGLVFAIPVWFFTPAMVHAFKMPPAQIPQAIAVFHLLYALLILSMVAGMPGTIVVSMQRMDLAGRNNVLGYLAYAVATVVLLRAGYGVYGVIGGAFVQIVVSAGLQWSTAFRLFGPIWHRSLRFDRAIVGRVFAFGGWTQLTSLLTIVSLDAGRFVAAATVSVVSVTYYELGSKLAFFSKSLPSYVLDAIMPAASRADARDERALLERIYRVGTLYTMFATFGIAGFLSACGDPIQRVWLGTVYPYVGIVILGLSLGYCANSMAGVGTTLLRAMGMPRFETWYAAIAATANVVTTVALAPRFGIAGVVAGTAAGWAAGTVYLGVLFARTRALPWWSTVGSPALRLAAAAAFAATVLHEAVQAPAASALFASRLTGLAAIALFGTGYGALYVALTWACGVWRFDQARLFERAASRGLRFAAGVVGR